MRTLILSFFLLSIPANAAVIKIADISDLNFGSAPQGDGPKTVIASTSENATNGSFKVTGNPNVTYTITLPVAPITMTTTGNGIKTISVSSFTSYPANSGLLDATGQELVFVGATRAALNVAQKTGSYSGSYSVTVVY